MFVSCVYRWLTRGRVSFLKWKSDWNVWNAFHSCNLEDKIQIPQPAYAALCFHHSTSQLHSSQDKLHTHRRTHTGAHPLSHAFLHWADGSLYMDCLSLPLPSPPSFPSQACSVMNLPFSLYDSGQKQFLLWSLPLCPHLAPQVQFFLSDPVAHRTHPC